MIAGSRLDSFAAARFSMTSMAETISRSGRTNVVVDEKNQQQKHDVDHAGHGKFQFRAAKLSIAEFHELAFTVTRLSLDSLRHCGTNIGKTQFR